MFLFLKNSSKKVKQFYHGLSRKVGKKVPVDFLRRVKQKVLHRNKVTLEGVLTLFKISEGREKKINFIFLTARSTNQVCGGGYKHRTEVEVLLEELVEFESEWEKTAEQKDKIKKEAEKEKKQATE